MKNRVRKCFHLQSQTMRYVGQVGFMKMDAGDIRCIKESAFAAVAKDI